MPNLRIVILVWVYSLLYGTLQRPEVPHSIGGRKAGRDPPLQGLLPGVVEPPWAVSSPPLQFSLAEFHSQLRFFPKPAGLHFIDLSLQWYMVWFKAGNLILTSSPILCQCWFIVWYWCSVHSPGAALAAALPCIVKNNNNNNNNKNFWFKTWYM